MLHISQLAGCLHGYVYVSRRVRREKVLKRSGIKMASEWQSIELRTKWFFSTKFNAQLKGKRIVMLQREFNRDQIVRIVFKRARLSELILSLRVRGTLGTAYYCNGWHTQSPCIISDRKKSLEYVTTLLKYKLNQMRVNVLHMSVQPLIQSRQRLLFYRFRQHIFDTCIYNAASN